MSSETHKHTITEPSRAEPVQTPGCSAPLKDKAAREELARPNPGAANWITELDSNPDSASSIPRTAVTITEKRKARRDVVKDTADGRRWGASAGPDAPLLPPRYRSIPWQSGSTRPELHGASRSFNSAAAACGARRAGEDARPRAHALTVAQHDPGAEAVAAVTLQAPARAASHCPLRAHRARYSCRRRVRHFLVGCEALRPFISLRMRKGSRVTVRKETTAALFPLEVFTQTGSKITYWSGFLAQILWRCLLRVSS